MIVIPMAGLSRRFSEAGYTLPKYMLPLSSETVFDRAVGSFRSQFTSADFLFIVRDIAGTVDFVRRRSDRLGIASARVVALERATAGQAETVELGAKFAGVNDNEALTIFNIDTFRPGFDFPHADWFASSGGYLEVFRGSGSNWSYVRPRPDAGDLPEVAETKEKRPISDLCCTGLYHFARAGDFRAALAAERERPSQSELYVAPLYNHLIDRGLPIHYDLIGNGAVQFCGVPAEYSALGGIAPGGES